MAKGAQAAQAFYEHAEMALRHLVSAEMELREDYRIFSKEIGDQLLDAVKAVGAVALSGKDLAQKLAAEQCEAADKERDAQ